MMNTDALINNLLDSYTTYGAVNIQGIQNYPNRQNVITILRDIQNLLFPGFAAQELQTGELFRYRIGETVHRVIADLTRETQRALMYLCMQEQKQNTYCFNLAEQTVCALIEALPDMIRKVLGQASEIERIAKRHAHCDDFFFIGRGPLYPAALEGALKLKEISYIHAEGYHAAELKHGPIALLDPAHPVVALANNIPGRDKMLGNIQECRARRAPVIALVTEGDAEAEALAGDVIRIPECSRYAAALPTVAALQLLAYYIAVERGCEIDQPRNLAKSVTVE